MLGHVLRMNNNTPAKTALLRPCEKGQGFRDRPRTVLPIILKKDLKMATSKIDQTYKPKNNRGYKFKKAKINIWITQNANIFKTLQKT